MAAVTLVALTTGCGSREKIARYTVPKPELIDSTPVAAAAAAPATEQETLAAIIVVGDMGWFFKLTGDPPAIEPQREAFLTFVKSIKFSSGAEPKPSWTLPEGWKELPGSGMRFATIRLPGESSDQGGLELTVIPLPKTMPDLQKFVLDNVNRWRGQLNLKPIAADELAKTTETFKVGDYDCTFVRLIGTGGGGMGVSPLAAAGGGAATPRASGGKKAASPGIVFEAPPEWTAGRMNEFRKASFTVTAGEQKAEITVIDLEPGSGDLLANVNRWRDQVGLSPFTAAELASLVKKIETLGVQGDYVELNGPGGVAPAKTILGVMAAAGGRSWFVKLMGDSELAASEKPRFEAFVKSLKLK
jgi:hypothetical protein